MKILCQPGGGISCGACCGMYNQRQEGSWRHTMDALIERTRAYRRDADIDDQASLRAFRARWEPGPEAKLQDGLPSCPFLGLIDYDGDQAADPARLRRGRVGCLVHPKQNDGVDGRDCGVYDRHICEDYLCASHQVMRQEETWLVLRAVQDSYLYGLVITDTRFVRELFERAAELRGAMPPRRLLEDQAVQAAARDYFELKRDWPWGGEGAVFGQVVPGQGLDTIRRPGPAERLGVEPDAFESILRCLGTEVPSVPQLEAARARVRERVRAFADALDLAAGA